MQATLEYHKLLERIVNEGKIKENRTGTDTISIFSHNIELDMSQGFPLITTKKMFTKGVIGELLWFLRGSRDIRELWDNNITIWDGNWYDQYSKSCSSPYTLEEIKEKLKVGNHHFHDSMFSLGPIYGKQWIDWSTNSFDNNGNIGINQIQEVVHKLNNRPDDRRIMVSAWNPAEIKDMALPPCHWAFELYTDEMTESERSEYWCKLNDKSIHFAKNMDNNILDKLGCPKRKLHLKWHQRSVDTGLGLPFNIASYAFLLHMFAQQADMVPGTLIGDLTNVHIYSNHIEQIKEQLTRSFSKYPAPTLKLNKAIDIFSYKYEDFKIEGYESYPTIKMPMSV